MLKNREDAEEVTQDTFLKALNAISTFRGKAKFSSFLYRICYNECINKIRRRKKPIAPEESAEVEGDIKDGFYTLQKLEQKRYLNMALGKLNPDYAMILTLFYREELTYQEIMEITDMTLSNVKVKLYRSKKALAAALNKLLDKEVKDLI